MDPLETRSECGGSVHTTVLALTLKGICGERVHLGQPLAIPGSVLRGLCWQCSRNMCHDTHLNPCTISLASEGDFFHRMYCQFFPCQFRTQHTIFMTSLSIFSKHVKKYNIYGLELFKASFQDHFASPESITLECFLQNQI